MIVRDKDFCSMICTKCHCVNFFLVLFVRRVILKVLVVWEELSTLYGNNFLQFKSLAGVLSTVFLYNLLARVQSHLPSTTTSSLN